MICFAATCKNVTVRNCYQGGYRRSVSTHFAYPYRMGSSSKSHHSPSIFAVDASLRCMYLVFLVKLANAGRKFLPQAMAMSMKEAGEAAGKFVFTSYIHCTQTLYTFLQSILKICTTRTRNIDCSLFCYFHSRGTTDNLVSSYNRHTGYDHISLTCIKGSGLFIALVTDS